MATAKHRTKTAGAASTPDEAARRLRAAGFKVRDQERREPIRPIDVTGLTLSKALDEARGKRPR